MPRMQKAHGRFSQVSAVVKEILTFENITATPLLIDIQELPGKPPTI